MCSVVGARLGAGHADGRGVRDGAPPAARGEVGGAGAGRGSCSDNPGPRVMVGGTKFTEMEAFKPQFPALQGCFDHKKHRITRILH